MYEPLGALAYLHTQTVRIKIKLQQTDLSAMGSKHVRRDVHLISKCRGALNTAFRFQVQAQHVVQLSAEVSNVELTALFASVKRVVVRHFEVGIVTDLIRLANSVYSRNL